MKAVNDLDFLNLFWAEAKQVGQKILNELHICAEPTPPIKKGMIYIVNFSDISGHCWGVEQTIARLFGSSMTLRVLAEKINYMILKGRANDVKLMLEAIVKTGEKTLYKGAEKNSIITFDNPKRESLGKGHFRVGAMAYTLTYAEIRQIKKYFNLS